MLQRVRHNRMHRRRGTIRPRNVDRVGVGRHQRDTRLRRRIHQPIERIRRHQPRIIRYFLSVEFLLRQPPERARIDQVADREQACRQLLLHLQRVAPVHEHDRRVEKHERRTRRSRESRRPRQPLIAGRQVFVLILVVVRNIDSVQPPRLQRLTQLRQRSLSNRRPANDFVGLSHVCASNQRARD